MSETPPENAAPAETPPPAPDTAAPMRLRPEPPRVTRLSRKVLLGIGIAGSACVAAALAYGLKPHHDQPAPEEPAADTRPAARPEALAGLPKDYSGPVLGPPLPGDLGRPMLDAQQRGQPVASPPITLPAGTPARAQAGPVRYQSASDPAQQRQMQDVDAARTARLFAPANTHDALPPPAAPATALPAETTATQDRQRAFLDQAPDRRTVSAERVTAPASPNILQAGAVIPAALVTGIRSDLPGQITAQVTQNIYDSPTGRILLIPQGARIIGQYDNGVGFGQRRVLLAWTRILFPDGRSITLERQPGTDPQGYAGLEDGVNYHWGALFKGAMLSTILSVGAEAGAGSGESDLIRAIRSGASNSISQTGQQIVSRQLTIPPTLTIRPGYAVRLMVTRDLILSPYGR